MTDFLPPFGALGREVIAAPAAGANFASASAASERRIIKSVRFTLTTDGTAANRLPTLRVATGFGELFRVFSSSLQAASTTRIYNFLPNAAVAISLAGNYVQAPWPYPFWLGYGDDMYSDIINIQAGDQLSDIIVCFESYVQP